MHHENLRESLRDLDAEIERIDTFFEITHPRLSSSIARALDALVQLGL